MTDPRGRTALRARWRERVVPPGVRRPSGTRHPLVAVAMALPLAVLLSVVFGGWEAVMTQASSVAVLLGR
ncbi:hypothetical protein [Streptomyces sp. NPDC059080]|uniref:hypothetical protein n=1 Tax=Streptomyces sp. NPDC059080 TaxID=3346718 RepID=UPI0036B312C9